ncbi:ankyrin repeat-containing protein [Senna tora]|uniref:Ankyrin repeat-containing protein n=1 Tax=Senna tora TaxID=362788 RepID=A0A834X9X4_9FABA|nr:ankyrin repeat-containing protein [Senna tora]
MSGMNIPTGMDLELYRAAVKGDTNAFKKVKGHTEIESILTPQNNTILHVHFTGDISEAFVEEILLMCPSLLTKLNAKGETLLHIASRYGHCRAVQKLIQIAKHHLQVEGGKGFIRAVSDHKKDTALHEAVCYNHIQVVDILTKEDPQLSNFVNSEGETPLYLAAERAYGDIVVKILENCESPKQDGPNGRTALHASILHNINIEVVSKLLSKSGSRGKEADENGWTALHFASLHMFPSLTELLLKFDRKMAYMRDKWGMTPLHFAAHCGNDEVVKKILEHCPDCSEVVDNNGHNALHHTAISNNDLLSTRTWKVILSNKSLSNLYNEKDNNGDTPLHLLAKNVRLFFKSNHSLFHPRLQRVDKMAFNKQNQTAMDVANHRLGPPSPFNETVFYSSTSITTTSIKSSLATRTKSLNLLSMLFMIIAFVTGTYAVLKPSKSLGLATLAIGSAFGFISLILAWKALLESSLQTDSAWFRRKNVANLAIWNAQDMIMQIV